MYSLLLFSLFFIQLDSNLENRCYILLAKLPLQTGVDLFNKFLDVLERVDQKDLAYILKQDQDEIAWGKIEIKIINHLNLLIRKTFEG